MWNLKDITSLLIPSREAPSRNVKTSRQVRGVPGSQRESRISPKPFLIRKLLSVSGRFPGNRPTGTKMPPSHHNFANSSSRSLLCLSRTVPCDHWKMIIEEAKFGRKLLEKNKHPRGVPRILSLL